MTTDRADMTLSYDRESDVLYITFEAMAPELIRSSKMNM